MSLRYEQFRALLRTREFLRLLMTPARPRAAKAIRQDAAACLRHFPPLTATGRPVFSEDDLTAADGDPVPVGRAKGALTARPRTW
jgi:hypothetical protein